MSYHLQIEGLQTWKTELLQKIERHEKIMDEFERIEYGIHARTIIIDSIPLDDRFMKNKNFFIENFKQPLKDELEEFKIELHEYRKSSDYKEIEWIGEIIKQIDSKILLWQSKLY